MTMVGTPIYIAPEILKNDRYDSKADVYSFAICLIAMMRADGHVVTFFFESLRKSMKRKHLRGVGINVLNNRVVNQGWRPLIPVG
jgi:serine/threonine protein kinase